MFYPHSYVSEECEKSHILCQNSYASQKPHVDTATLTKGSFVGWPLGAWGSCTTMQAEKLLSTHSTSVAKDPDATAKPAWIY